MPLVTYENASTATRVWPNLTDPETGRTLELSPGEQTELDLPAGFSDPYLKPVTPTETVTHKSTKSGAPTEPASAVETKKE